MKVKIIKQCDRVIVKANDVKQWSKIKPYSCPVCNGTLIYSHKSKTWLCGENQCSIYKQVDWVEDLEREKKNNERSRRRSRAKVVELSESLRVDRMLTLTFQENIVDIDVALKAWKEFNRLLRVNNVNMKYVCVPELQKRGAIHFHVAISKYVYWRDLWMYWKKAVSVVSGLTGGIFINKNAQKAECGVARYIAKYINKCSGEWLGKGRKRYYSNVDVVEVEHKISWHDFNLLKTRKGFYYGGHGDNKAPDTFGDVMNKVEKMLYYFVTKYKFKKLLSKISFFEVGVREFNRGGFVYSLW